MYQILLGVPPSATYSGFPALFKSRRRGDAQFTSDPRPPGCRKLTGSTNDWRIRVGDYRIIYEIADTVRIVRVNRVRHRRDVYR